MPIIAHTSTFLAPQILPLRKRPFLLILPRDAVEVHVTISFFLFLKMMKMYRCLLAESP